MNKAGIEGKLKVGGYYYFTLISTPFGGGMGIIKIKKIVRIGFTKNKAGKLIDNRSKSYCIADILDPYSMNGPIQNNQKIFQRFIAGPVTISEVNSRRLLAARCVKTTMANRIDAINEF